MWNDESKQEAIERDKKFSVEGGHIQQISPTVGCVARMRDNALNWS